MMGQFDQVIANGGLASPISGSIGDPTTVADDVIVDGRIITAENFDSSIEFGLIIAAEVIAAHAAMQPVSPVQVVGDDLVIEGTDGDDIIYVWGNSGADVGVWINGVSHGMIPFAPSGRVIVYSGSENHQVFATDLERPATIYGDEGHDLIVGGSSDDVLDGGPGVDRVWGGLGNDLIRGGDGNDFLIGREGNDILLGGAGNDWIQGYDGNDFIIGSTGSDRSDGGAGDDLLIGGTTSYDEDDVALLELQAVWSGPGDVATRFAAITDPTAAYFLSNGGTIQDDGEADRLIGGLHADLFFAALYDSFPIVHLDDLVA